MFQINSRFFIGLFIVLALSSLTILTKNVFIIVPTFIVLTGLYLAFFFISLSMLNKVWKDNEEFNKKHQGKDYVELTREEARQMKKEGAFEKDGKYMIDEDYELWKQNKKALKDSQRLQSQMGRN